MSMEYSKEANRSAAQGMAEIEKLFVDWRHTTHTTCEETGYDEYSDHWAFAMAGVPVGSMYSGSSENKTAEQVKVWGGTEGISLDPNYHSAGDTLENMNM